MASVFKVFIMGSAMVAMVYTRHYLIQHSLFRGEYFVIVLLAVLGMMVMVSGSSMLTLYLGLEILSLSLYTLIAIARDRSVAVEAALKYFVLGAIASGLLLYGISMVYGISGSIVISEIATFASNSSIDSRETLILNFGLVFLVIGVAFKLGAVPFHMWVPDVYEGSPTCVAMLISNVPKIAGFALAIRLLVEAMPGLALQWHEIFILVAILSMAIGNIVAIAQTNLKRMLAYSSIAHMGYMILGLACATPDGDAAAMFYIVSYSVMTVAAFGLITLVSRQGFEAENIDDFSGLNSRNPWLAFLMLLVMFSLAGIPPIVGFIAKLGILEALIQVHLTWLAVVALLFAIIGAYYYLRVVKVMYFEEPVIAAIASPRHCNG
jgi:NADH-quinone oxidoreductase subunit N